MVFYIKFFQKGNKLCSYTMSIEEQPKKFSEELQPAKPAAPEWASEKIEFSTQCASLLPEGVE